MYCACIYNVETSKNRDIVQVLKTDGEVPSAEGFESVEESGMVEKEESGGVTRIKVVITKKQLQDLLSKQVLAADILSVLRSETYDGDDDDDDDDFSTRIWKPKLESIPEEHETSSIFQLIY
ncbi:hypothetical protein POM88_011215 [Heracleum sosnowskyi]|uniref:Uncharacterized protein n=1 Tax=Heracleum sosnowskyi TaxID=360622 RepID=A0AAD8IVV9_9APIA|nr:hypothetical protein POM88_011215 [Heracleum sosnowskyi]